MIKDATRPKDGAKLGSFALYYARKGVPVFPLAPGTKIPLKESKGVLEATTDPATVIGWWKGTPEANIGAACGVEFDVLDVDSGGLDTLETHGEIPSVAEVATPTGGSHIYFAKCLVALKNGVKFASGLDFRTTGGYVVLPPSIHPNGKEYRWREGSELNGKPLPEVPMWMVELLKKPADDAPRKQSVQVAEAFPEGERNSSLFSHACFLRNKGLSRIEVFAGIDIMNQTRCRPPLPSRELDLICDSAMKYQPKDAPGTKRIVVTEREAGDGRVLRRKASTIQAAVVPWLALPHLPLGMLAGIDADPGTGKSYLCAALAAAVSTGAHIKDIWDDPFPTGNVLMLASEDSSEYTTVKRLQRFGANLDRIEIIEELWPFDKDGLELFARQVSEVRPLLVTIDPITAFLDAATKVQRNTITVHDILTELKRIAAEFGCCIVCIRHLRKSSGMDSNALYSGMGGIEIVGKYRSSLQLKRDPENKRQVVATHVKSNVGPIGTSFAFEITPISATDADFTWVGKVDATSDDFMPAQAADETRQAKDAFDLLRHELQHGERPAKDLFARARQEGVSEKALRIAREKLCGKPRREGFGSGSTLYWSLKDLQPEQPVSLPYKESDESEGLWDE